ncbi:MAG: hypothetical protein CL861_01095 [Cyanobium sp. MED843]|nr:hypothetical protein [Cyanobium sp. MED843]OUW30527.1 MAG: hypothetical protein CBD37_00895 [Cyanobacteria bacterium TMED177]
MELTPFEVVRHLTRLTQVLVTTLFMAVQALIRSQLPVMISLKVAVATTPLMELVVAVTTLPTARVMTKLPLGVDSIPSCLVKMETLLFRVRVMTASPLALVLM